MLTKLDKETRFFEKTGFLGPWPTLEGLASLSGRGRLPAREKRTAHIFVIATDDETSSFAGY